VKQLNKDRSIGVGDGERELCRSCCAACPGECIEALCDPYTSSAYVWLRTRVEKGENTSGQSSVV